MVRCGGAQIIKQQIADGVEKRRIGLISRGPPARQHSEIKNEAGEVVGEVTSSAFSPTLKKNVAMGYRMSPRATARPAPSSRCALLPCSSRSSGRRQSASKAAAVTSLTLQHLAMACFP